MQTKPFLIVSDIHLGAVPPSTEQAFRAFLTHAGEVASGVLINGDLFDFWFEYRTVVHREHFRVVAQLADLVDSGVPVWFMGGNHDAWGGSFLRDEVGIRMLPDPATVEIAGRRALVAHGDGVGRGDRMYRALRWLLRNRLTVFAFRQLHPDWGSRIAQAVSTTEGKAGREPKRVVGRAEFVREWAEERLAEDPSLQLVIAGHVHLPTVLEVEPGRYYVNSGDWLYHFTYVRILPGEGPPELVQWPIS